MITNVLTKLGRNVVGTQREPLTKRNTVKGKKKYMLNYLRGNHIRGCSGVCAQELLLLVLGGETIWNGGDQTLFATCKIIALFSVLSLCPQNFKSSY